MTTKENRADVRRNSPTPLGAKPQEQTRSQQKATICLHNTNTISLIHFSFTEVIKLRDICTTSWPRGILSASWMSDNKAYQVRLCGKPWVAKEPDDHTANLLQRILRSLYTDGWSVNSMKGPKCNKTTINFAKNDETTVLPLTWTTFTVIEENPELPEILQDQDLTVYVTLRFNDGIEHSNLLICTGSGGGSNGSGSGSSRNGSGSSGGSANSSHDGSNSNGSSNHYPSSTTSCTTPASH